jgi:hypothetical protein
MTQRSWTDELKVDPLPVLLAAGNPAIPFFAKQDLLEEDVGPSEGLWQLPEPQRLVRRQLPNGAWPYPGGRRHLRSQEDYDLIEAYRSLGLLVEKYALDRRHPSIERAAAYLFSRQTDEGDFRGIYGTQYSPNYSAGIMELLIKAGFDDHPGIEKGFQWLLSTRQDDGGWMIPMRGYRVTYQEALRKRKPLAPIRSKPFSHLVTGVVLRAFAAHPLYRESHGATKAADLLMSRFFQRDTYVDRSAKSYWEAVSFPFWFTDIVSGLDSLSRMGLPSHLPAIQLALNWLKKQQHKEGWFQVRLLKTSDKELHLWICLAVCRCFKRFYG